MPLNVFYNSKRDSKHNNKLPMRHKAKTKMRKGQFVSKCCTYKERTVGSSFELMLYTLNFGETCFPVDG